MVESTELPKTDRSIGHVVTPGMRKLLLVVFVLVALLVINSVYLVLVSLVQQETNEFFENAFYQSMFLVHLLLGLGVILPTLVFVGLHLRRAWGRANRIAVRLGLATFISLLLVFVSGLALTRGLPLLEVKEATSRQLIYWLHIIAPIAAVWFFVLHRLAGPRIRWKGGAVVAVVSIVLAIIGLHLLRPGEAAQVAKADFFPALTTTTSGGYLTVDDLMMDQYCASCHPDVHAQWAVSAHRFASFNNPAYAFSVNNTRSKVLDRHGNVEAARFCAGCHDPVLLLTGAFDDPDLDVVNNMAAHAGITCMSCHSIVDVTSPRGNGAYLIEAPRHYPFARSDNPFLRWLNGALIKGKPEFHKRTFLKEIHRSPEFCGSCHKVHLPKELNDYKWLRGQNHYDSFLLSGVSGHGVMSFYYPEQAEKNCNGCHMRIVASRDFGAKLYDELPTLAVRDHQFAAANTALADMAGIPVEALEAHRQILRDSLRLDIFAIREGDRLEETPTAPIDSATVRVGPGKSYVFDVVLRTLTLGHHFTQGTSDSNEVWLEVEVSNGDQVLVASGTLREDGSVDPNSHFVNSYMLDRFGSRIAERNAEDIFTKLYDHQIAPGSASVVHYRLDVPSELSGSLTIRATLNYRKFDTTFLRAFRDDPALRNDLPITLIADDEVLLVAEPDTNEASTTTQSNEDNEVPEWMRWNDYGIGWLNKPNNSALRQAEYAFQQVADFGRGEGHLNLARVYLQEGRLDEATTQLQLAEQLGAYPWSIAWFGGLIDLQSGQLDEAIRKFKALADTQFVDARNRGFNFALDYRLRNTLARTYFERSKLKAETAENPWLQSAIDEYVAVLRIDPENVTAHYGLATIYALTGDQELESFHREQHETYRVDDNARDIAVATARRNDPIADHVADDVVIFELQANQSTTPAN